MASKKKATVPAPASKKPVVKLSRAETLEIARKERIAKRATKSAENKARYAANVLAAKSVEVQVVDATKLSGKKAALTSLPNGAGKAVQGNIGRPWTMPHVEWTENLGRALHSLIATGHTMKEIAEMDGMPPLYQQLVWLADKDHPYVSVRARAKEALIPLYEEMAQSIAMNPGQGIVKVRKQVVTRDGDTVWVTERRTGDNTERAKLALQGLQWSLSHLQPKKHGRTPDNSGDKPNEQLEGLFAALKAGPVK